jgi:hypothetical protein
MEQIKAIADRLEVENSRRMAANPAVQLNTEIVKEFIKSHRVLLYGGTAINDLLPKNAQFYNPEIDIPDFDFFSKTPQEDAMTLANKLHSRGIRNVEVKPGIHLGTFKVFANFEGVADITQLDEPIFESLWNENVTVDGVHYVTPNFLRMSMYLELSRPRGDVSRWVKIYKRLTLLNKYYPIRCKKYKPSTEVDAERRQFIKKILATYPVVLLGVNASQILTRKTNNWTVPVVLLAEKEVIAKIISGMDNLQTNTPTEILPPTTDILDSDKQPVIRFYETTACHSFHMVGGIRVASIPTIMQFFFAYIYSGASEDETNEILCVAQHLIDVANKRKERRFDILTPMNCIGNQDTIIDIKADKAELYAKLEKNKSSVDFLRYFFTYNPSDSLTRRKKKRDLLKKTRKDRLKAIGPIV